MRILEEAIEVLLFFVFLIRKVEYAEKLDHHGVVFFYWVQIGMGVEQSGELGKVAIFKIPGTESVFMDVEELRFVTK